MKSAFWCEDSGQYGVRLLCISQGTHVFPWLRIKYNLDDCPQGSRQLVTPYKL